MNGKKNFQSTKTLYLSLKTSYKDYDMKIKSLMKVKEVRKIQIHGIKENKDEDEEEHHDQPNANGA